MKRMVSLLLSAAMLLCFTGCTGGEELPASSAPNTEASETTVPAETVKSVEPETEPTIPKEAFSYSQLQHRVFQFSSGAGGWATDLRIASDGSFSGDFHDSNMGITGPDYPNGSVSLSNFTGRFAWPVKVDDYTYSLKLESIRYEIQPGTTEIRDGVQYCYGDAYGLADAQELLLYLPGTPLDSLPEDFLIWAHLYGSEKTTLPFYGLYDPLNANGFYSFHIVDEVLEYIKATEAADQALEAQLMNAPTQSEMNIAADQRYVLWDDTLNELWAVLQEVMDESTMQQLTNEELQWIKGKEQSAEEAAAEVQGGSLYPTVYYGTAAQLTKERVYDLMAYLPQP